MKPTAEMEEPAKRWEVAALNDKLESQGKQLESMNNKLDLLVKQPYVTESQIKDWIKVETDKVYAKYDPVYSGVKWLAGVLVVAVVGQIVNIWFQITRST